MLFSSSVLYPIFSPEQFLDFPYFVFHRGLRFSGEIHFFDDLRESGRSIIAVSAKSCCHKFMSEVLTDCLEFLSVLACPHGLVDGQMSKRMWWVIGQTGLLRPLFENLADSAGAVPELGFNFGWGLEAQIAV